MLPGQLPKLEAIEGNWASGNTGYVLFALPDVGYVVRTMRIGPERDHPGQPWPGVVTPGLARGEVSAR